MKQTCKKLCAIFLTSFLWLPAAQALTISSGAFLPVGINLPAGVTATAAAYDTTLDPSAQLNTYLGSFLTAFGRYYGEAVLLGNHLTYPLGKDNLGQFPGFTAGLGFGAAFANTSGLVADSGSSLPSGLNFATLPSLALSFNLGIGINRRFDVRLSFFPRSSFALPPQNNLQVTYDYGNLKAKLGYHVLEGGTLQPGFTLSAFLSSTQGSVTLTDSSGSMLSAMNIPATTIDTITATTTNSFSTVAAWNYYGGGLEARLWYDLLFAVPYLGYGLGLQGGSFTTTSTYTLNMQITDTATSYSGSSTTPYSVSKKVLPGLLAQRIFVGMEFSIFVLKLNVEAQFVLGSTIAGFSAGTSIKF